MYFASLLNENSCHRADSNSLLSALQAVSVTTSPTPHHGQWRCYCLFNSNPNPNHSHGPVLLAVNLKQPFPMQPISNLKHAFSVKPATNPKQADPVQLQGCRKQFLSGQANQLQICPDREFRMIIIVRSTISMGSMLMLGDLRAQLPSREIFEKQMLWD